MKANTHRYLFGTSALMACLALPTHAFAGPQDGNVTAGNANIDVVGNTTTINQSSDRAIIRWKSFDIDSIETVKFNQPNSGSITVNRINDTKASRIDGKISANGNIILINPNGMVFGAGSTVDVGGLVATTSDLENDNAFMAGGAVKFTKPGNADGRIVNNGSMTVRDGGLIGLVAPHVENHGIIQARLGKAVLASGDIHTIDFAGDGLIKLELSDDVTSQSVTNTGTITADGGQALLTAAQARGMVDALITNTGTIRANTININGVEKRGSITLSTKGIDITIPRGNGMVFNTGTIQAEGLNLLDSGGIITILSDKINIGDGSYVTATGDLNGGTIKIGGNYQGGSGLPTSDMIYIAGGAILNAESRRNIGDGGTIILWSDTNTRFYGHSDVSGLNGGLIEVSSKGVIDVGGTFDMKALGGVDGVLLLDPTDITISTGADNNVSGASPFSPTVDNGPSVLNITTLQAALASGSVIVQTRATGAQTGAITVSDALTWSSGTTLTLDAHGAIIVNAAISAGTGSLTMLAGGDIALNAAVSGTGTLTFEQAANTGTVGIGTGATGVLNLNATDLGNITDGWGNIIIGKTTSTAAMDVRAVTWNDNLTLRSDTGVITFTGVTDVGTNDLTIVTGADVVMTAGNLTGQGTLRVEQASATTTMGLAGGAGTVNFTAAELNRVTDGWSNLIFGRTDSTVALIMNARTWTDALTVQNGSGTITFAGVQTMGANNLTINTDGDLALNVANVLYGSGVLTIYNNTDSTTFGLGSGAAGTINLTSTEVDRIRDGWSSIVIGRTDGTGTINLGGGTWDDTLTIQTGSGAINTVGTVVMGANTLTLRSDTKVTLGGSITGTGTHTIITNANNISIGLGDGQAGTHNYTNADLAYLATTGSLVFGRSDSTADLNVGARTWLSNLTLQTGTGALNINGAQTMGAKNVTLRTDSDVNIGATITSTGTFLLTQSSVGTSMGIMDGQAGAVHLSTAEGALLGATWASRVFGRVDGTGALNVGSGTHVDPMTFRTGSGALNINGAVSMGANALTISTDADLLIGGNLTGTGTITITQSAASTVMGVGTGQTGALYIDDTERNRIINGWGSIVLGSTTSTGGLNIGTATWNDVLTLRSGTGVITVNGTQTMAGNNLTITGDGDLAVNGALTGTGTLAISGTAAATVVGVGDGATGAIHLSNADIANITNGWTTIAIGTTSQTGALNVAGTTTWNDNLLLRTTTGIINIVGTINTQANNLSLSADSNINIAANLIGSGTLAIYGSGNGTTVGIGTGQAGTVAINDTELAFIQDGWSALVFGKTSMTGALNIGGRTWNDSIDLRTNSGALNINGTQNMGTNNLTLRTNTNLVIGQNLVGSGTISILASTAATTMGIGTGQAGTLQLSDTELNFIVDGWTNIIFGSTTQTGAMNVGARTWADSVEYRLLGTASAFITINGAQNVGANNMTIRADFDPVINAALTGTGTLSIYTIAASKTMGLGTGAGTVSISDAELNLITNGWSMLYFGNAAQTGAMNISARTWNDSVTFNTSTGVITVSGDQTMGANDLTFTTSGNLALNANLTGTGTLTVQTNAVATTMTVGNGGTGTLAVNDTELARIINGWDNIVFGRMDGTGTFDIRAQTWNDNVTFRSAAGVITVNGAQNAQANNMTFMTNGNLTLNANLAGTGNLVIRAASGTTGLGVGTAQTGAVLIDNTELGRIVNGWGNVTFGATNQLGEVNIGAYTWNDVTYFLSQANIVINGTQTSTEAAGTSLVFATTGGAFINNAGGSAINPGGGRYLVYSVDQGNDTLGGLIALNVVNPASYAGYGPASVVETGNVFLYSGAAAKIIYVQIDDINKIYGDGLPTFTYTYLGGLQGADILTDVILTTSYTAAGASVFDSVGTTRTVAGNFSMGLGYTITYVNGTMTVIPATITVTMDSDTRIYGDANPTFTSSYSGFKNGDDILDIDTVGTISTAATLTSNVGNYTITASGDIDNNYIFNYVDGNLAITKAALVATANNTSRTYGDANPTFTFAYSGFKNSDTAAVIDTGPTGSSASATANVGTYTITGSGAVDNNYSFTYVDGTLTVNKAMLTVTADDKSKTYGDANPALTVSYSGFKNSDTSANLLTQSSASTTATALTNVGTAAITASGGTATNYNFTYVGGTLTINKAVLTATASNTTRVYGDANPALTVSYSGFKNSDTVGDIDTAATATTAANLTSNVGSYATTASGGVDNNYTFSYVDGSLAVTKATLTATASSTSRVYGDANPALTVSYSGFKNSDTAGDIDTAATASTLANLTSNVGSYATTAAGGIDNNYTFSYVDGSLAVTKAMLTATASSTTRVYGDANPALTVSYSGFKNSDGVGDIDTAATATTAATLSSNVGSYATTASGGVDNNYNFTYVDGTLGVTKAVLTATASSGSREYGDANPALTVSYSGFKNSDTAGDIDTAASATTGATILSNVGTYATTAAGGVDNNYSFAYVDGALIITKATLTATASSGSREYGDANPALTVSYSGFKNGETAAVINTSATAASSANATSNVGSYATVASGASDNNYNFNYVDGTLSVTKAMLTATASNGSRAYGDANPALTVSYSGFKNSQNASVIDTAAIASSAANATSNVGIYATTATGASDNNYDFTYVDGTLTINKATLTAMASSASREYGDANPALTVSYSGFKNGETASVINAGATASTAATNTSNVGTYSTVASGALDDNYTFSYVNGVLTVTKAMLTVNAGNATRVYGDANPTIGVSYTGFKNGETTGVLNTQASASSTANALSNVGSYTTTSSGGADNNYDFTHVGTGTLSVTKATLTTYADNQTRKQYEANPTFTVTYSGFKNGDTTGVLDTGATASTLATPSSAIGAYDITASGGIDNNYSFVYVTGTLTVLDPDYIPPPPASTNTLPSTVQQTLTPNTHSQSVLNQSMYNAAVQASKTNLDTIPESPLAENVIIIAPDEDFDYIWSQDPFLIALTQTIEDYFELIKAQN